MLKLLLITAVLLIICWYGYSQSLTGTTGLVTIPTAEMQEDGSMYVGCSYVEKQYSSYGDYKYNAIALYGNFAFLPFLELNIRVTRLFDHEKSSVSDRMPNFRLRLFKETRYLPSIVYGMHSFLRSSENYNTIHYNSTFLVLSKHFSYKNKDDFGIHLGYGVDIVKASTYQFIGFFGGVSYSPLQNLNLMAEYDAKRVNLGVKYELFKYIVLIAGLKDFKFPNGSVNFKYYLLKSK